MVKASIDYFKVIINEAILPFEPSLHTYTLKSHCASMMKAKESIPADFLLLLLSLAATLQRSTKTPSGFLQSSEEPAR